MDLAQFRLHSATFEVRYEAAFLIWDQHGQIWTALRKLHPTLVITEATPGKVVGIIDRKYQIAIEVNRVSLTFYPPPSNVDSFVDICGECLSFATSILEVSLFTRVGLRVVYRNDCKSRDEASEKIARSGMIKIPSGKHFGIEGLPKLPSYALRWEGDKLGSSVTLRAQERKVVIEPGFGETAFSRIEKELYEVDFDIDYYTMVPVDIGQFRARDWILQAIHVIRRDSKIFLGD